MPTIGTRLYNIHVEDAEETDHAIATAHGEQSWIQVTRRSNGY